MHRSDWAGPHLSRPVLGFMKQKSSGHRCFDLTRSGCWCISVRDSFSLSVINKPSNYLFCRRTSRWSCRRISPLYAAVCYALRRQTFHGQFFRLKTATAKTILSKNEVRQQPDLVKICSKCIDLTLKAKFVDTPKI